MAGVADVALYKDALIVLTTAACGRHRALPNSSQ